MKIDTRMQINKTTGLDPIDELVKLKLPIEYTFRKDRQHHICQVVIKKDRESIDCYGVAQTKDKAQVCAAHQMLGLTNLLFPSVPLGLFSRTIALSCEFTKIDRIVHSSYVTYDIFHFTEIKTELYLYVLPKKKTYCIMSSKPDSSHKVLSPICPISLLNEPIRYTDWSCGPIIPAQEAYLSKRLEKYYS
jgi:hypothetical protein